MLEFLIRPGNEEIFEAVIQRNWELQMVSKSLQKRKYCFKVGGIWGCNDYCEEFKMEYKERQNSRKRIWMNILSSWTVVEIRSGTMNAGTLLWICAQPLRSACVSLSTVVWCWVPTTQLDGFERGRHSDMLCRWAVGMRQRGGWIEGRWSWGVYCWLTTERIVCWFSDERAHK